MTSPRDIQSGRDGAVVRAKSLLKRQLNQSSVAITSGVNLISSLLTGTSGIVVARILGPYERGIYASAITWGTVAFTLAQFGVNQSVVYAAAKQPVPPKRLLAAILTISMFQSLFFIAVAGAVSSSAVVPAGIGKALSLYCLYLPSWLIMIYLSCFNLGMGCPALFNLFKFLTAVPPFLAGCSAAMGASSVTSIFQGFVLFGYLILAVSLYLQFRYGTGIQCGHALRDLPILVRYGARASWSNIFAFANLRLDQLILSTAVPLASLGMYSVATSYSLLIYPFSAAIANLLFPKMTSDSDQERAYHLRRSKNTILLVMTVGTLVLAFFQRWLLPLLYGRRYHDLGSLVAILCAAAWCLGINYVLSDALRGLDRPGLVSLAEGTSAGLTLLGLYVAIPRLGIIGAAWVSLAAYSTVTIILASALSSALRPRATGALLEQMPHEARPQET